MPLFNTSSKIEILSKPPYLFVGIRDNYERNSDITLKEGHCMGWRKLEGMGRET